MAFPVVGSTNTANAAASTSLAVAMPSGISAGDLLLIVASSSVNDAATTACTNFTAITAAVQRSSGTGTMGVWGKVAAGGDTSNFTGSSGLRTALSYRITAASWSGVLADVKASILGGALATLDPPSLTPGFGAEDYLWLAACRTNGTQTPTAPASYTGLISAINGNHRLVTCQRNRNIATEDPGAFGGGPGNPLAATIAIRPAAAAASPTYRFFHDMNLSQV